MTAVFIWSQDGDFVSKSFTRMKRDEISEKLKEGAMIYAAEVGMKKTSVDSLVAYAGISKGAFYNFFESKDELFLELVEDWHTEIYGTALETLMEENDKTFKAKAARAILQACVTMCKYSVLKFYRECLPQLLENIKGTELMERYHSDDVHIAEVIRFSGIKLLVTEEEAVSLVKNIAFTILNADMKGYWYAQKILINSVCDYVVK